MGISKPSQSTTPNTRRNTNKMILLNFAFLLQLGVCFQLFHRDDDKNSTTDAPSSTSSSSSKTTSSSSSISINPALPAGGVDLQTPVSSSTTYIKSGEKVTFGWNYTSLVLSPSAINIEVSCSQNNQVYTLAQNQSIQTSSIVWDTNKAGESGGLHLISAEYTLVIHDASKSESDIASAGELSTFDYTFGIYVPQVYHPWPYAAKYVNFTIRLSPPALLTFALTSFACACAFLF